jgi:RNA polymerase sigma-70 factor (ECF subfamily)
MEASDPTPDVAAERGELRARVEAELARLPEQRRTAFRLVDVDAMTTEEAARIMGVAPGTVRSHLHHARMALRKALAEHLEVSQDVGG